MYINFSHSCILVAALSDMSDEVVKEMPPKPVRIGFVIVPLTEVTRAFGVSISTEACMIVVLAALIV